MFFSRPIRCIALVPFMVGGTAVAEPVDIDFQEVTNLAATVSPDGSQAVLDIQGVLWRLDMASGETVKLTEPGLDPARPHWGPSGDLIVMQAYQQGTFDIWMMDSDGEGLKPLTGAPWDEREPELSPDGSEFAFVSDRDGSYDVWTMMLETGALTQWTDTPEEEAYPTWAADGNRIAYVADRTSIKEVSRAGDIRTLVSDIQGIAYAPSWSAGDNEPISWIRSTPGKTELMLGGEVRLDGHDVFPFRVDWQADGSAVLAADGQLMRLEAESDELVPIPFAASLSIDRPNFSRENDLVGFGRHKVKGIVTPALHPDGNQVAFAALNDLWLMTIGEAPQRLTNDVYYESDPAWSPDGERLAYVSDRHGALDIWIREMASGKTWALTNSDATELYPAWSPDGSRLVYQNASGDTKVIDIASGESRAIVEGMFQPGRASWSADGKHVALAGVVPYTSRFREGTNQVLVVAVASGEQRFYPVAEHASITTRSDNGPVWSPDGGKMSFVLDGALYVMDVSAEGRPTGEPRRVAEGVADSPSWSGDASRLLFLKDGQLKMVSLDDGEVQNIDVRLEWSPQELPESTVVHVGRLWDGASDEVLTDVDITVVNGRIAAIGSHDDSRPQGNVIDASELTAVPGLIEGHTHQTWGNHTFGYGARQGRLLLSMGITSTVSVGDLAYRAVGDHEAIASGKRVGPRFFYTGGPLDGSRIYYNAMRPVADEGQLAAELERAEALDFDVMKTYVRMNPAFMKAVSDEAGQRGVPTYSHFLAPGVYLDQSGTTHLGATERLDYSRIGSLTGRTYQDVIDLFSRANMSVVSTFFAVEPSLFGDNDIRDDVRVKALVPRAERDALQEAFDSDSSPDNSHFLAQYADNPETFARIVEAGGWLIAGSDSPLDFVGFGLHSNLRWLESGPLTPFQALRSATAVPAMELGLHEQLGTLEVGKMADIAFVRGKPDEDIRDLIKVEMVMKGGHAYRVEDLVAPFSMNLE